MVASASTGSNFAGLAGYLGGGDERVGWVETRGVFADDVPAAVAEMREQAALSARCEKPVYHVTIAFDPSDNPTEAEIREAVDRTLRDVGLEEHQALVVRHVDREHAHVHVMVNRVGPDGRAWSTSNDRQRLRASVEQQERELGVRWTGRNARAAGVALDTDRGFAREVRDRALADFKDAPTWGHLEARLSAKGLRVERRGRGAVVTDGTREAKLSSVSRTVSRSRLEERLGGLTAHERGGRGQAERRSRRETGRRPALHRDGGELRRAGSLARRGGRVVVEGSERDADETLARTGLSAVPRALARARISKRSEVSMSARTAGSREHARDARRGGRLGRVEEAVREHVRSARLVAERNKTLRVVARVEARAAEAVTRAQKGLRRAQTVGADTRTPLGLRWLRRTQSLRKPPGRFWTTRRREGQTKLPRRWLTSPSGMGR